MKYETLHEVGDSEDARLEEDEENEDAKVAVDVKGAKDAAD